MSNILAPYCGGQVGLPVNDSTGASAGVKNQHLWVFNRRVEVLTDGTISHYGDGLPFNDDGRLLISIGAVVDHDQGIPFTASGHVAVGPGPIFEWDQGLPLNAAGQLITTTDVNNNWPPPPLRPPETGPGPVVTLPNPLIDAVDGGTGNDDLNNYSVPVADSWEGDPPAWVTLNTDGTISWAPMTMQGQGSFLVTATDANGSTQVRAQWVVTGHDPVIDTGIPAVSLQEPAGVVLNVGVSHPTGAQLFFQWQVFDTTWKDAAAALSDTGPDNASVFQINTSSFADDGGFTSIRCRVRAYVDTVLHEVFSTNSFEVTEAPVGPEEFFMRFEDSEAPYVHTRASSATGEDQDGNLVLVPDDEPVLIGAAWTGSDWGPSVDPATYGGLQLEDTRTNYAVDGEYPAGWGGSIGSTTLSPNTYKGRPVLLQYIDDASPAFKYGTMSLGTFPDAQVCTIRCAVRNVSGNDAVALQLYRGANFDPDSYRILSGPGTLSLVSSRVKIDGLSTTEWTELEIVATTPSSGSAQIRTFLTGLEATAGVHEKEFALFQVEQAPFATSYIPCDTGSAVMRAKTEAAGAFPLDPLANDFCFQAVVELVCNFDDIPDYAYLCEFRGDQSNRVYVYKSDVAGRVTFQRNTGAGNTVTSLDGFSALQAGDILDMKMRISSATGITVWANATGPKTSANTNSLATPATQMALNSQMTLDVAQQILEMIPDDDS